MRIWASMPKSDPNELKFWEGVFVNTPANVIEPELRIRNSLSFVAL
jgi:hypothetical protein